MPCLRGVEVSLVQGIDPGQPLDPLNPGHLDRRLPEFPHPDSSSVRLSPRQEASQQAGGSVDEHRLRKSNSRVSVYVPSDQGLRFAVEWHIKRPEEYSCYIYFVVLFNGRRIVSWGTDPNKDDRGITEYALYEQSNKWDKSDPESASRSLGYERRYFYFISDNGTQPANDGGLIEVQAFRARGRRLRAPAPPEYRGQENYGIACPSGGSVESSQDLSYYDWHLYDRVDDPFTIFRFYYRSLESLQYLSIVPTSYHMPEVSCRSNLYFGTKSVCGNEKPNPGSVDYPDIINQYVFGSHLEANESCQSQAAPLKQGLQDPLKLFPILLTETQQLPQPSKSLRDASSDKHPERPLPMLPQSLSQSSSMDSLGGASSVRSRASTGTASIAPSLWDYVNDLSTDFEEAEICDARAVSFQRLDRGSDRENERLARDFPVRVDSVRWEEMSCKTAQRSGILHKPLSTHSSSEYGNSLPSSEASQILANHGHIAPVECSTELPSDFLSSATSNKPRRSIEPAREVIPVFIPEGQWIKPMTGRRTPSPLRRRQTQTGLNLLAAGNEGSTRRNS